MGQAGRLTTVKPYVVASGLPASGKTTLARRLTSALELPLIDKDDILDRLFEERGIGDPAWRRRLSRESDRGLQDEANTLGRSHPRDALARAGDVG